jgi:hypothetical protein
MKAVDCCETFFSNVVAPKKRLHHEHRLLYESLGHCRGAGNEKRTHLLQGTSCASTDTLEYIETFWFAVFVVLEAQIGKGIVRR